ncbi:MAG: PRC-barrel domain-containing protein [Deltaproteobacteria bacterium]
MKGKMILLSAMTLIAFVSTGVFAGEGIKYPMGKASEDVSLWIGKEVMNIEGEKLGTVKDFVRDPDGRLSFAIVSHGGFLGFGDTKVAVPYSALTYDQEKQYFTCDFSRDRFANAPELEDEAKLHDRSYAEEIYRYFGLQPYWTEESKTGSELVY